MFWMWYVNATFSYIVYEWMLRRFTFLQDNNTLIICKRWKLIFFIFFILTNFHLLFLSYKSYFNSKCRFRTDVFMWLAKIFVTFNLCIEMEICLSSLIQKWCWIRRWSTTCGKFVGLPRYNQKDIIIWNKLKPLTNKLT